MLTFDDGWRDFYEYAFPVIKKHQVPGTVFLPTDFIETDRWFWTDRLSHLLLQRERAGGARRRSYPLSKNPVVNKLENLRGCKEARLEAGIELLKEFPDHEIEKALCELSEKWELGQQPQGRAFLSWKEVEEMKQSNLVSYGSHTAKHKILTQSTDEEIGEELERSKRELVDRGAASLSFIPFCYPNGNFNDDIAKRVREAGFHLAVTTRDGWNQRNGDLFKLNRIGVHQDMAFTSAMYACRITGFI